MSTNVETPGRSESQRRFLDAYRQRPRVAPAARLAGVHRATVYRWLEDTDFAAAVRAAYEEFYQENRARVSAEDAERRRWREERERARRPMRCHYLALARAAKGRNKTPAALVARAGRPPERPATQGYTPHPEDRR